jgi:hypothetical protein
MIGTTASQLKVTQPELSWLQPQPVAQSGDGRDDTSPTPLLETDTMNVDRKTHVGYPRLLRVSRPSSGPQTKSPTSTSTSLSRAQEAGWMPIRPPPGPLGQLKT